MSRTLPAIRNACLISLLSMLVLTGCNRTKAIKVDRPKPTPLVNLASASVNLAPVLRFRAGGTVKNDPLSLQPARVGQLVYGASRDGQVAAYTLQGQRRWQVRAAGEIMGGVAASEQLVVVSNGNGEVLALDAATGRQRWKASVNASVLSSAVITPDQVIVQASDGVITALNAADGKPRWTYDTPVTPLSIRGMAAPLLINNLLVVTSPTGRLYALDTATGLLAWERRVAVSEGRTEAARLLDIDQQPVLSGQTLYPVSYQGQLVAFDLGQQQLRWDAPVSSLRSAAVGTGNVYVATTTGEVRAYDEQTGKLVWTQELLRYRDLSNPVVINNRLVIGDGQGYLHVINQLDGKLIGRARVEGAIRRLEPLGNLFGLTTTDGHTSLWQVSP